MNLKYFALVRTPSNGYETVAASMAPRPVVRMRHFHVSAASRLYIVMKVFFCALILLLNAV